MFGYFFDIVFQTCHQLINNFVEGTQLIFDGTVKLMDNVKDASECTQNAFRIIACNETPLDGQFKKIALDAKKIILSERQRSLLIKISNQSTSEQRLVVRAKIILALADGKNPNEVAKMLGLLRQTVYKWRDRWFYDQNRINAADNKPCKDLELAKMIKSILLDAHRCGKPATFTAEQIVLIIALACEHPKDSLVPLNHWTSKDLVKEIIKRGIVDKISDRTVRRLLKEARIKPHLSKYWLNAQPEDENKFNAEVKKVCDLYKIAPQLHAQGIHVVCVDEKTGIQVLEHKYPVKLVKPGLVARIEHEYIRNGTLCFTGNFEVATGKILNPTIGESRTEEDFLAHIKQTVATDPKGEWIFVSDNLNTHKSASLVEWIANECNLSLDCGIKGKSGILKSMESRSDFISDPNHRIYFMFTPKHTSWLNQIEIWFSILVGKVLKRSSFKSKDALKVEILNFVDYFNVTMAKPFKWTYEGKPLTV